MGLGNCIAELEVRIVLWRYGNLEDRAPNQYNSSRGFQHYSRAINDRKTHSRCSKFLDSVSSCTTPIVNREETNGVRDSAEMK